MGGNWIMIDHTNTAGFYKYESEQLFWGRWVKCLEYELYSENYTEYNLPIDGWYWFNSKEEACEFFNIKIENDTIEDAQTTPRPRHNRGDINATT